MTGTPMPEGTPLGEIGQEIIFENEHVRVWALRLAPGESQPWHRHDLPYMIVPILPGSNVMTFADGRTRETSEVPGDAMWREAGAPHMLTNMGAGDYQNVLIEFKTVGK